jgi:hypothetical protein
MNLFVAKSSPEQTRVPRHVTGRLSGVGRRCRRPCPPRWSRPRPRRWSLPARGGEAASAQGGAEACGGCACSCMLRMPLGQQSCSTRFCESSKGGRSSRGPTTQSSTANDRDKLRLQNQCLGWGPVERSAPPVHDNSDDDGGLDISCFGSNSESDGGAPSTVTTSAQIIYSSVNVFFQCACWTCDGLVDPLLICSSCVYVELEMN